MMNNKPIVRHVAKRTPIFITHPSFERIGKEENRSDTLALFVSYTSITLWQGTYQVYATTSFMAKKLNISEARVRAAKKVLAKLGLINNVVKKDGKTGAIIGNYIDVNFIWEELETRPNENREYGDSEVKCLRETNKENTEEKLLSIIAQNDEILNNNDMKITPKTTNEIILLKEIERLKKQNDQLSSKLEEFQPKQLSLFKPDELIQPKHFETFYWLYPRKAAKGKALLAWGNLCNQKSKANIRPTWKSVRKALILQKKTELWMTRPELIPYPASWINSNGWLNEPDEMIVFKPATKEVPKKAFGFVGKPLKYSEPIKM